MLLEEDTDGEMNLKHMTDQLGQRIKQMNHSQVNILPSVLLTVECLFPAKIKV